jgi:PAS domain S-box-containing protein
MRDYLHSLLSPHYSVEAAADGERALAAARREPPDLILTDVMMPRLDGYGLVRSLRADERLRDLPVLMLSARAGEEARLSGLSAGVDDYLEKPFSARELFTRIGAMLELRRARRDSDERFRTFVEATFDVVYRMSPDFQEVRFLKEREVLVDPANPRRDWLDTYIADEDKPAVSAAIADSLRTGAAIHMEHRARRPDGVVGWVDSRVVPLRDGNGRITEWFGTATDVTIRKNAELRLNENAIHQEFLVHLDDATRSLVDPIEIQRVTTTLLGEHLKANRVSYFQVSEDDFVVEADYVDGVSSMVGCHPNDLFGARLWANYRSGLISQSSDVQTDDWGAATERPLLANASIRAFLGVPLIKSGNLVAGLAVHGASPRVWTDSEVTLVQAVAERTWAAVERTLAEIALRDSEDRLRISLEATKSGAFDWNLETQEVQWTDGHYRTLGLTPGVEPASYDLWRRHIHPDDVEQVMATLQHALDTGERYHAEYRVIGGDGVERWAAGQGLVVARPGEARRMVGAITDITERKRADEALRENTIRMRRMANVDGLGFLLFRASTGVLLDANDAFCKMFGYARDAVQSRAMTWQTLTPPEHIAESERQMQLFAQFGRIGPYEKEYFHADGSRSWTLFAGVALGDDTIGEYCIDISDRKRAEMALLDADRQKDEFLAMLAHELRNPLASIGNASELLTRLVESNPRTTLPLTLLKRQTKQLTRLVDDLLDISRLAQGRITLEEQTLEIGTVIDQAIETVQPSMREKDHHFVVSKPQSPIYVRGDQMRLSQAVSNVLQNAAKYTESGGDIRLDVVDSKTEVAIEVHDNGAGIAAELLPHVFDLFVQSAQTLDRSQGGLGIGLSVVKRLIEMHRGSVSAASRGVGQGATFTLRLPRTAAPEPAGSERAAKAPVPIRRIVVVDDNVDAADSLAMRLQIDGHDVHAVYSAAAAIDAAARYKPDLMFLDIGLPQMDGYEVARRIRSTDDGAAIRLIALTGYGQPEDRKRSAAAGFNVHIIKPVSPDALNALLAS